MSRSSASSSETYPSRCGPLCLRRSYCHFWRGGASLCVLPFVPDSCVFAPVRVWLSSSWVACPPTPALPSCPLLSLAHYPRPFPSTSHHTLSPAPSVADNLSLPLDPSFLSTHSTSLPCSSPPPPAPPGRQPSPWSGRCFRQPPDLCGSSHSRAAPMGASRALRSPHSRAWPTLRRQSRWSTERCGGGGGGGKSVEMYGGVWGNVGRGLIACRQNTSAAPPSCPTLPLLLTSLTLLNSFLSSLISPYPSSPPLSSPFPP